MKKLWFADVQRTCTPLVIGRERFFVDRELISRITKIPLGNVRLPRTSDERPSCDDISVGLCGKKVVWS